MRPLRLEMEGFATFRDRTEIDFSGLDLVALVGPTGSGKSTVIDAVTFALYGSVARYDNASLVAPVIHQLSTEAKVRFDFELAGEAYSAVRVVRRVKSKPGAAPRATTKEARLERLNPEGASTVLAGNVTELDREVQELIGLDFSQFTRTIVLPQGEFAEFLKDDPGNRQKLLRRLLDLDIYARMGARARRQASEAERWVTMREEELARLDSATPQRLVAAQGTESRLSELASTLPARLDELAAVDTDLEARRQEVGAIDRSLAALGAVSVPDDLLTLAEVTTKARDRAEDAGNALELAQQERAQALQALDAAPEPLSIKATMAQRSLLLELQSGLTALDSELDSIREQQAEAVEVLAGAERRNAEATSALREARTFADASGWIGRLRRGEPCPICRQEVHDVPDVHGADELAAMEADADRVRRVSSDATATAARIEGRVASLEADVAHKAKAGDDLAQALADQPELSALTDLLAVAEIAVGRADQAATALRKAEKVVAEAGATLDRAVAAEARFNADYVCQRDAVVDLDPPAPQGRSLTADWRALCTWAVPRLEVVQDDRRGVAEAGKQLAATKAELTGALGDEARALDLDPEPGGLRAAVAAARATLAAEIERIGTELDRKTHLSGEIASLVEQRRVLDSLGRQHLSAGGFERWLLAEALDDLVARATVRLLELSNGCYSLEAVDGSFTVRDHGNADERRDIRTLSGGEIFLASLALALALADSIAELATVDGPRLESIFLDEGFGTLDGETLDVLAVAIEELSASGRLVCVVTHVRDLAERMPVRFEVRKGSTTSTIERVEG